MKKAPVRPRKRSQPKADSESVPLDVEYWERMGWMGPESNRALAAQKARLEQERRDQSAYWSRELGKFVEKFEEPVRRALEAATPKSYKDLESQVRCEFGSESRFRCKALTKAKQLLKGIERTICPLLLHHGRLNESAALRGSAELLKELLEKEVGFLRTHILGRQKNLLDVDGAAGVITPPSAKKQGSNRAREAKSAPSPETCSSRSAARKTAGSRRRVR